MYTVCTQGEKYSEIYYKYVYALVIDESLLMVFSTSVTTVGEAVASSQFSLLVI